MTLKLDVLTLGQNVLPPNHGNLSIMLHDKIVHILHPSAEENLATTVHKKLRREDVCLNLRIRHVDLGNLATMVHRKMR